MFLKITDNWMFAEDCDIATMEQMEGKWNAEQMKTNKLCEDYLSAKRADAEEKDHEVEREAETWPPFKGRWRVMGTRRRIMT